MTGDLVFESEDVTATWCLPIKNAAPVDFSHGTEVLANAGDGDIEVVDVTLLDAHDIEVEDYWFSDLAGGTVVGTLIGWPPRNSEDLHVPFTLASSDSVNLVVHLVAPSIDLINPPTTSGLRLAYRQDGIEYTVESNVGVRLRRRC